MTDEDAWKRSIERELGEINATLDDRARSRDLIETAVGDLRKEVDAVRNVMGRIIGGLIVANILLPLGVVIWAKLYGA